MLPAGSPRSRRQANADADKDESNPDAADHVPPHYLTPWPCLMGAEQAQPQFGVDLIRVGIAEWPYAACPSAPLVTRAAGDRSDRAAAAPSLRTVRQPAMPIVPMDLLLIVEDDQDLRNLL